MRCCCCFRRCRPRRWWPRIAWHRVGSACFSEPTVTRLSPPPIHSRSAGWPAPWQPPLLPPLGATLHTSNQHHHAFHLRNLSPQLASVLVPCRNACSQFLPGNGKLASPGIYWSTTEGAITQRTPTKLLRIYGAHRSVKWNRRPSDWDGQRPGPSLSAARKRGRRLPGASLLNPAAPSLKQI